MRRAVRCSRRTGCWLASSPDLLAKNRGDLCGHAGRSRPARRPSSPTRGAVLKSRELCYWKVRSWDGAGKPTAWSSAASWEMGLLQPEDWQAKWIESSPAPINPPPDPKHLPEYAPVPLLRTEFTLPAKPIVRARLYVTALGLYEMHLNGQRVGDHIFCAGLD